MYGIRIIAILMMNTSRILRMSQEMAIANNLR